MKELFKPLMRKLHKMGFRQYHATILTLMIIVLASSFYDNHQLRTGQGNAHTEKTEIHFIDVGQGDSELILSGSEAILIDAGPRSAAQTVVKYLKDQGVTELAAVVATHPHEDHIGGMPEVFENFQVKAFYMPDRAATSKIYERTLDAVENEGLEPIIPDIGDRISMESGAYFTVLNPPRGETFYKDNTNNYSIVLRLAMGKHGVLFMGDAEKDAEAEILRSNAFIKSDVIKLGHHGSSTSSTPEFLRKVDAKAAILSYANGNEYGHPHKETMETLKKRGMEVHATAKEGTIVLTFDAASQETDEGDKKEAA